MFADHFIIVDKIRVRSQLMSFKMKKSRIYISFTFFYKRLTKRDIKEL